MQRGALQRDGQVEGAPCRLRVLDINHVFKYLPFASLDELTEIGYVLRRGGSYGGVEVSARTASSPSRRPRRGIGARVGEGLFSEDTTAPLAPGARDWRLERLIRGRWVYACGREGWTEEMAEFVRIPHAGRGPLGQTDAHGVPLLRQPPRTLAERKAEAAALRSVAEEARRVLDEAAASEAQVAPIIAFMGESRAKVLDEDAKPQLDALCGALPVALRRARTPRRRRLLRYTERPEVKLR